MTAAPPRDSFRLFHSLRVRWAEVAPPEHRFQRPLSRVSPHYADVAITEYFRTEGIAYPADLSRDGGDFFAIKTVLEHLAPARFDDLLEIGVRVGRLGRSSMSFNLGI